ncbi:MAG: TrmH family RNA methyltransferase [Allobaculum sp.]|uniref:TrmH family RNA methyltransferase n=1 Tax=Allobaculum sp. TaxID=1872463 RepID=UPI00399BE1D1
MKIESLQNAAVKAMVRLKNKKDRDASGQFLVEGFHMIQEAAQAGLLLKVYQLENLETLPGIETIFCSQPVLNKMSAQKSDARYIGLCKKPAYAASSQATRVLLLDQIQDPGNMGTLIRSALSFGIEKILCSADCTDPFGPKTLQSSQGAIFHLPVVTCNLAEAVEDLKSRDISVFGAALHQDSVELHELAIPDQYALIIGNEGQGIRPDILQACTKCVHIEMKTFESLNAAIAGSILMYVFQFGGSNK